MTFIYFIAVLLAVAMCAAAGYSSLDKNFKSYELESSPKAMRAYAVRTWMGMAMFILGVLILLASVAIYPWVQVWSERMHGMAELARAENNRQIKVAEANATAEAAMKLAVADVRRAEGVRQANEIIAGQLGGPENYLRFLSIEALKEIQQSASTKIIYVPTEANLPITEAMRFQGD